MEGMWETYWAAEAYWDLGERAGEEAEVDTEMAN